MSRQNVMCVTYYEHDTTRALFKCFGALIQSVGVDRNPHKGEQPGRYEAASPVLHVLPNSY